MISPSSPGLRTSVQLEGAVIPFIPNLGPSPFFVLRKTFVHIQDVVILAIFKSWVPSFFIGKLWYKIPLEYPISPTVLYVWSTLIFAPCICDRTAFVSDLEKLVIETASTIIPKVKNAIIAKNFLSINYPTSLPIKRSGLFLNFSKQPDPQKKKWIFLSL